MITALFNAIAGLPALVSAIESLIAFISDQLEQAKKKRASEEMAKATEIAKEKKDTSGMDKMFNPDKTK